DNLRLGSPVSCVTYARLCIVSGRWWCATGSGRKTSARWIGGHRDGPRWRFMNSPIASETFLVPRPAVRRKAVWFGFAISAVLLAVILPGVKEWSPVVVLDIACILGLVWAIALTESHLLYWLSKRHWRLYVGPEGVCLEQGAARQLVPWTAITRVVVRFDAG